MEVETAAVVAREEVAAAVVAKVAAAAAAAAAAKVAVAAKDKATPVDGQARPATLRVEAGRTQGNPSELDWRHLVCSPRNGAGRGNYPPPGRKKDG